MGYKTRSVRVVIGGLDLRFLSDLLEYYIRDRVGLGFKLLRDIAGVDRPGGKLPHELVLIKSIAQVESVYIRTLGSK